MRSGAGTSAGPGPAGGRAPGLRGCGLPHTLRPVSLRSLYFRISYLWSPVVPESVCSRVTRPGAQAAAAGRWRGHGAAGRAFTARRYRSFAARAPSARTGWRLSHEVTDFRSSSSVVPRSLPARPRSMSTATRISVFSVIRSPSPPRWRLRVRRILASSSSWSARSRSSLRSRRCHLGICDSVTPAVPASRGPRATRRGAGLARLRLLHRGRRCRLSGRGPRRKDGRGLVDLAEQVGDTLPGHQLMSFPAAIRPRSSSSSVCTRLTSSRTFAAYRPLNWMTVCRLACAVEYAR